MLNSGYLNLICIYSVYLNTQMHSTLTADNMLGSWRKLPLPSWDRKRNGVCLLNEKLPMNSEENSFFQEHKTICSSLSCVHKFLIYNLTLLK